MSQSIPLTCPDGRPLNITEFAADSPVGSVVICSAFGVSHSFYHSFAEYLASKGYTSICFDYRGTGHNNSIVSDNFPLSEWATQDIEAVLQHVASIGLPVHVIGHSIGGQILGLAPSSPTIDSIVMVAASAPYWKRWPRLADGLKIRVNAGMILPLMSKVYSPFPAAKFGLGNMDLPSCAVREWASWMREPNYLFEPKFGLDVSAYSNIRCPILSLAFTDDLLAPIENIDYLMRRYNASDLTSRKITPKQLEVKRIGHTGLFKGRFKSTLWDDLVQFFDASTRNADEPDQRAAL